MQRWKSSLQKPRDERVKTLTPIYLTEAAFQAKNIYFISSCVAIKSEKFYKFLILVDISSPGKNN